MTIKRIVDGEELSFELTKDELLDAHNEQEHLWDCDYCKSMFENFDEEGFLSKYGIIKEHAEKRIDDIAYEMRRQINKYDLDADYARECAFTEVLTGKEV